MSDRDALARLTAQENLILVPLGTITALREALEKVIQAEDGLAQPLFDLLDPDFGQELLTLLADTTEAAATERQRIEKEVLAALRAEVEALPGWRDPRYSGRYELKGLLDRDAVLAILAEREESDRPEETG